LLRDDSEACIPTQHPSEDIPRIIMAQTSSLEGVTDVSLTEELLLLTLEDTGGEFDSVPEIYLNCGIAGAALMDLSLRVDFATFPRRP